MLTGTSFSNPLQRASSHPTAFEIARCHVAPQMVSYDSCPLAACPAGSHATVISLECSVADADRLRTLGLFEGAGLVVIGRQSGILLDVRGSRLAIGRALAAAITVQVLGA